MRSDLSLLRYSLVGLALIFSNSIGAADLDHFVAHDSAIGCEASAWQSSDHMDPLFSGRISGSTTRG